MCRKIAVKPLHLTFYAGCLIILIIGTILIWLGFLVSSSELVESLNYTFAGSVIVASGFFLMFLGFLGFFGIWSNKKLYLVIFSLSTFTLTLLMISFGLVIIYIKNLTTQIFYDQNSCLTHFYEADQLSIQASNVICSIYCPCTAKPSSDINFSLEPFSGSANNSLNCNPCENIQIYNQNTQENIVNWINSTLGYRVTNTSCAVTASDFNKKYFKDDSLKYAGFFTWLEKNFHCSGLCHEQNVLMFSDVSLRPSNGPCYTHLKYWVQQYIMVYGICIVIFGMISLGVAILAFYLGCCYKIKENIQNTQINIEFEKKEKNNFTQENIIALDI